MEAGPSLLWIGSKEEWGGAEKSGVGIEKERVSETGEGEFSLLNYQASYKIERKIDRFGMERKEIPQTFLWLKR